MQATLAQQQTIVGVYQGKSLFVQNPYLTSLKSFCIKEIKINNQSVALNYKLSALVLDFKGKEKFTPVKIDIYSIDSTCVPVIINPDAITYHTSFSFQYLSLSDTALFWRTKGESPSGTFTIEKLNYGLWIEEGTQAGTGIFEESSYSFYTVLSEGPNKFRIKYDFGKNDRCLYSDEIEYNYILEPVEISPRNPVNLLTFSRSAEYRIFDQGGQEVLSGLGKEADVSKLFPGNYIIYFDGIFPMTFVKEKR